MSGLIPWWTYWTRYQACMRSDIPCCLTRSKATWRIFLFMRYEVAKGWSRLSSSPTPKAMTIRESIIYLPFCRLVTENLEYFSYLEPLENISGICLAANRNFSSSVWKSFPSQYFSMSLAASRKASFWDSVTIGRSVESASIAFLGSAGAIIKIFSLHSPILMWNCTYYSSVSSRKSSSLRINPYWNVNCMACPPQPNSKSKISIA